MPGPPWAIRPERRAAAVPSYRWRRRRTAMKAWLILNINFTNMMVLHLVFVGSAALFQGTVMNALLADALWRAVSVSFVLAACVAEDVIFLRLGGFAARFSAETESEEARPFQAFLWFCTVFLLVDSLLCVAELEPVYAPLFLIGSSVVLMFLLIRFLFHIDAIMREERQRGEHDNLSAQLEAAQEHADALKRMTDRDTLAGVLSRRFVMEWMRAALRAGQAFSIAFLDLDGLKNINDREGHDAGDRHLIGFCAALSAALRASDLLARVGGDEFLVLMPGCGSAAAQRRVEAVRAALEAGKGGTRFRFSYGVAAFPSGDETDADALLREADRAMYQDKARRRTEEDGR